MAKSKKREIIFPRHVYKKGGSIRWDKDHYYSREYVENEAEYKAALATGYVDDFSEAIFGEEEDEDTIEGDFSEETPVEETISKSQGSDFSDDDF